MAKIAVLAPAPFEEFDLAGYDILTGLDVPLAGQKGVDWLPIKFNAEQLFSIMAAFDIDQCWVVPGCAAVRFYQPGGISIMFEKPEDEQGKSFVHDDMHGWKFNKYGDDYLSSIHGYKGNGTPAQRKLRSVIWPEFSGWQWEEMDGYNMLAALNLLQAHLGVDLSSSPGVTGRKFVVEILKDQGHAHWLGSVSMDLAELPLKAGVADLAWKKDLGRSGQEVLYNLISNYPAELAKNLASDKFYLHCVDKNSMYLSAAAGLPLGVGDPVHHNGEEFEGKMPKLNGAGLYQISARPPVGANDPATWRMLFDGTYGPTPLYKDQEYVSTSLLKLLYDFGYTVEIEQAWIWPNSKRILEVPAARLWAIRQELWNEAISLDSRQAPAAALAYQWVKVVATSFIGLFASEQVKDIRYKRRDIWRAIIETAKARMLYNIDKVALEEGIFPVGVLTDALYYVSPEQSPAAALGKILDRTDQLGGFKLEYTLEIDAEVAECLAEKTVGDMARKLKKIAEMREAALWI